MKIPQMTLSLGYRHPSRSVVDRRLRLALRPPTFICSNPTGAEDSPSSKISGWAEVKALRSRCAGRGTAKKHLQKPSPRNGSSVLSITDFYGGDGLRPTSCSWRTARARRAPAGAEAVAGGRIEHSTVIDRPRASSLG